MIYTVTLSPALDYLVWLDHYEPGSLNRTNRTAFRPGGKGINVSVVLQRLGFESICLGFTAGFVGDELVRLLDEEKIRHDFIRISEGCSRINVKIKADTESEINAYGPQIPESALEHLKAQAAGLENGDILILSGNPPKNMPPDIYSLLMDAAAAHDVRVVVDSSGSNLLSALEKHPYLVKPNKAELEEIIGSALNSTEEIASAALTLQSKGARNVLVSLGPDGGLLAADDGKVYTCGVPKGKLIDSTGAGDSMVAGFVAKSITHDEKAESLRFAVACGCASSYSYGLLEADVLVQVYQNTPRVLQILYGE